MDEKNKKFGVAFGLVIIIAVFVLGFNFGKASNSPAEANIFSVISRLFGAGKVRTAGDVSVVSDETADDATIILGNTRSTLGAFSFSAANDTMIVKKMQILVSPLSNPNNPNGEAADEVPRIYLYDGDTLIGSVDGYAVNSEGQHNAGIAFVTGFNWVLQKNTSKTLTVKGEIAAVGFGGMGSDTGASVYSHVMSRGFEACSMSGSYGCDTAINPASSAQRLVYKSKPILEKIPFDGQLQAGAAIPAFRFRISADQAGNIIEWIKVQFDIGVSNATMGPVSYSSVQIYRRDTGDDLTKGFLASGPDRESVGLESIKSGTTGLVTIVLAVPERIPAGTYRDYELRLPFSDVGPAGTAIAVVRLYHRDEIVENAVSVQKIEGVYDGVPSFVWSDYSAAGHSTSTPDWANPRYVRAFWDWNEIHN